MPFCPWDCSFICLGKMASTESAVTRQQFRGTPFLGCSPSAASRRNAGAPGHHPMVTANKSAAESLRARRYAGASHPAVNKRGRLGILTIKPEGRYIRNIKTSREEADVFEVTCVYRNTLRLGFVGGRKRELKTSAHFTDRESSAPLNILLSVVSRASAV